MMNIFDAIRKEWKQNQKDVAAYYKSREGTISEDEAAMMTAKEWKAYKKRYPKAQII